MKTKHLFGIALALMLVGAMALDAGLQWTGGTCLTVGALLSICAPVVAGVIHSNNGEGF